MDEITVSVITPSYNQAEFIEDTLRSVNNQTYKEINHTVIDGGSDDDTIEILKQFKAKTESNQHYSLEWISEPDEGQSHAINKGFQNATGDVVGWLNSDDVYFYRDTVERMVN